MKEQFTDQDLVDTLHKYLWPQYQKYSAIHGYMQYEDVFQECILGFYEIMKSTGMPRLQYYAEKFEWLHVRNIVRLSTYQHIPNLLKSKHYKNKPLSLNAPLFNDRTFDGSDSEFMDIIPSLDEELLIQMECSDILDCLDEIQLEAVTDMLSGQTKTYMRNKYPKYDRMLKTIQSKVRSYYEGSGDILSF